jgi:hypothetical protein
MPALAVNVDDFVKPKLYHLYVFFLGCSIERITTYSTLRIDIGILVKQKLHNLHVTFV